MHLIRRAALRGLRSQPIAASSSTSTSSATARFIKPQEARQILWQKRFYSEYSDKAKASPAEEEGGQTVTTEPSAEQQRDIKEESVAAPSSSSTTGDIKSKVSEVASAVSSAADNATGAVRSSLRFNRPSQPEAEPSKILYIGNLYFDLTPEQLRSTFESIGNVVNCKIVTDSSGMSKGFGYVEFDSIDSAAQAIEQLHGQRLEGRPMSVQYHLRRMRSPAVTARNPPSCTLFIGNISFQASDKDLHDLFRPVKNVLDVRVAIDRRSGQPRGFAHADFTDVKSAEEAKEYLQSKVVYGRPLRIDFGVSSALSKPRDQPFE